MSECPRRNPQASHPVALPKLAVEGDLGLWVAVLARLVYRSLSALLSWLALWARSSASKNAEILRRCNPDRAMTAAARPHPQAPMASAA
jgi:hypothetical protein